MVTEVIVHVARQDNMCATCSAARPVLYTVRQCNFVYRLLIIRLKDYMNTVQMYGCCMKVSEREC